MESTEQTTDPRTAPLPLLADPAGYRPNTIDMVRDARARRYWLDVFEHHTPGLTVRAAEWAGDTHEARRRAEAMADRWLAVIADLRRDPAALGDLSILTLCSMRQRLLAEFGFGDVYEPVKRAENEAALALLPPLLEQLDALPDADRPLALLRGVFAGNIFDLGCSNTIELYESGRIDFHATAAALPDRPWLVDDLDAFAGRLASGDSRSHGMRGPYRKAILLVDNAGADVTLGMIPLARHLLRCGTHVILSANTQPALNDITHEELAELIDRVADLDAVTREALGDGRLVLVASGNGLPVIDLSRISPELAAAARGADLLVIEGMGRALETNYDAAFTCDTLKIAMVKEQDVADLLGGKLYDVVCRFEPARGRGSK